MHHEDDVVAVALVQADTDADADIRITEDEEAYAGYPTTSADGAPGNRNWRAVTGICLAMFWIHCQPSEAYLTKYLRDVKGLTEDELNYDVWPVDTYASLVTQLPLGFLAESLGYRLTVCLCIACREATRVILIYGSGVRAMAAMQGTYAVASGGDTILFALIYMFVDDAMFRLVSVFALCAHHGGSMLGSAIGEGMMEAGAELVDLFYVSWLCTTIGLLCFVGLVDRPIKPMPVSLAQILRTEGVQRTWAALSEMYASWRVQQWTMWWVLGYSANYIIGNYFQNQFSDVDPDAKLGAAAIGMEACSILGALASFVIGRSLVELSTPLICGGSLATAALLFLTTVPPASNGIVSVATLNAVAFGIAAFQLAAGSSVIAACAASPRYSILFTVNVTLAYIWAAIVQAIGTAQVMSTSGYFRLAAACHAVLALAVFTGSQLK